MTYVIKAERNQIIRSIINKASTYDDLKGLEKLLGLHTDSKNFFNDFLKLMNKKKPDGTKLYPIIEKLCSQKYKIWDKISKSTEKTTERYRIIIKQLQSGKDIYKESYFSNNTNLKLSICEKIEQSILKKINSSKSSVNTFILKEIEQLQIFNSNMDYKFSFYNLNDEILNILKNYILQKPYLICLIFKNIDTPEIQEIKFHNKSISEIKSEFLQKIKLPPATSIWQNDFFNPLIVATINNTAANKIQAHFKGYKIRHTNEFVTIKKRKLVDIKTKEIIIDHMKQLNNLIKYSPSAEAVNKVLSINDINIMIEVNQFMKQKNDRVLYLKNCIENRIANCMQLSIFLYILIENDPNLTFLNKDLHLIKLKEPDDHVFLLIGNPDNKDSLVIDPWIKYLNLDIRSGFRNYFVSADERSQGFIGTKAQYLHFINNHKDGTYLKFDIQHQFIVADQYIKEEHHTKWKNKVFELLKSKLQLTFPA
ncbi:MAG TPA: hypothetical protein PKD00_07235 [Burkholderiales bacterium]|nr:hypothetical protein [Burkholderiales bacterium]